MWNLSSLISVWSSVLALQAGFLTPGPQGSPDVVLNFMELTYWWRVRICQIVEINILIVKSITDVMHVSYRLSPTWGVWHCLPSQERKRSRILSQCWFCKTTADVITCTASFHLQDTDILSMSVHRDALRNPGEVVLKTISLLQVVVGSLDDGILFFRSNSPILFGWEKRRTDTILTHLALANLLIILFSGIPHIMAVFVLRNPLNSCGCKFVYYIQRVACGTALCSTCVLSTCQSFTLTPRKAEWVTLRGRASRVTGPSHCICWMLSLLMNICVPLITGPENARNDTDNQGKWFCSPTAPYTAAPWCFSCTDSIRGCSIFTPPLGTADAPWRPEPPTSSWCWCSPLSSSMCWILSFFKYITAFLDLIYGLYRPLVSWLHVFPLFPPSCCSWGILELLGSDLELLEKMVK